MGRKTNPREGGMETPPDAEGIARAFMEEELAKDRPKPAVQTALSEIRHPERSAVVTPEPQSAGTSSQNEVDAYIASLDAQVTDETLLTPYTKFNKRRAEELSRPFDLSDGVDQSVPAVPATPATNPATETRAQVSAEAESFTFVFPRLGQNKGVRYLASDGSVYEITKKPGGYRITKEGDPAIASISRTDIMKRGQTEGWQLFQMEPGLDKEDTVGVETEETYEVIQGDVWVRGSGENREELRIIYVNRSVAAEPFADIQISTPGQPGAATSARSITLAELQEKLRAGYQRSESVEEKRVEPSRESLTPPLEATAAAAATAAQAEAGPTEAPRPAEETGRPKTPVHEQPPRETVPLVEMNGVQIPENEITAADLDKQIATLREEVANERAAFIAVEESQRSAWKNLTRIFRGLSHKDSDDAELMKYRAFYDEKVLVLQNAELEKLKRSGKTVKELRPEMAALIREFEFDEAERIYDARQEMRLAKTNQPLLEKMKALWADANEGINGPTAKGEVKAWVKLFAGATGAVGSSTVQGIEKGGAAYNKLMRSKYGKLILAASVGTAAVGIATGGVGTAAVGLIALKRLAAGAGVAVTLEDVSERMVRARREKRRANVEQDHEKRFDAMESEEDLEIRLGNKEEIDFSKLEKYLKEVSAKSRKGEGARRRNELLRKSGAIFAGAVLGSGAAAHFANEYIGGASKAHAAARLAESPAGAAPQPGDIPVGGPGSGPSLDGSPAVAESLKDTRAIPVPTDTAVPEALKDTRAIPVPAEVSGGSARALLESHEVKRGESIWKIASKAVQDVPGMDERASGRFAKLVELRLAEKLEKSPELARAAGFVADADGKFSPHQIQAGAKLELGKLLSQDELTKMLEEAKGENPISVPSVAVSDTPIRETVTLITTPALSEAEIAAQEEARIAERVPPISAEERAAVIATFPESPTTELIKPNGNVMKYIETLPRDEQEKLFRNFKRLSTGLFQTNEVMGGEAYDMRYDPAVHPELTKAKLSGILADHKLLAKNPLVGYDRLKNPLHWSQMEEVTKFAKASAKAFGESVAQPKVTESVQEYTLRMIAIARNQGVKISGFRMVD